MDSTVSGKDLGELVWFVHSRYGVDLTRYRPSCIARRVAHRMALLGIRELDLYIAHLDGREDEMNRLLDTITIHVTGFFRDGDVFSFLCETFYPRLIESKLASGERILRAWSAGCATGEEAYSLAIQLADLVRARGLDMKIEVFGTDVSEEAIRTARKGEYDSGRLAEVPPSVIERHFSSHGDIRRVSQGIRSMVKFHVHNVFNRPPFSLLDLAVCRNVLIHFGHEQRDDVMLHFHESLRDGGHLILGKSEAVTGAALRLFEIVSPRHKLYRKLSDHDPQGGV